jgi:RNA polymerase sigma-70 factor (ECF subfamily)
VFPTDWGLFADLRGGSSRARRAALDILARRYWKPVYAFLRHTGHDQEAAKDLTQAFFADWIENDVFSRADASKGRFRAFMRSCLKRFVTNQRRAADAQKRKPAAGLLSLDALMGKTEMPFTPADPVTPEMIFDRAWATELVQRVLRRLEQECRRGTKERHFDIFARRIIRPILEGTPAPSLSDLGREHGISKKEAGNHLLTARRAYQRLLRDEIRLYARSEDEVSAEVREVFRALQR